MHGCDSQWVVLVGGWVPALMDEKSGGGYFLLDSVWKSENKAKLLLFMNVLLLVILHGFERFVNAMKQKMRNFASHRTTPDSFFLEPFIPAKI